MLARWSHYKEAKRKDSTVLFLCCGCGQNCFVCNVIHRRACRQIGKMSTTRQHLV